jgi:2-methylcitrate dehydratase PrpD
MFAAYGPGSARPLTSELGKEWELLNVSLRAWPVAVHLQCVVTGVLDLLGRPDIANRRVRDMTVQVSPTAHRMHATVDWRSRFLSRLSTPFVAAVVATDRQCGMEQFTAQRIADPEINQLAREHVTVIANSDIRDGTASVEMVTDDGATARTFVDVAKGEPSRPLLMDEIEAKFTRAASPRVSPGAAKEVIELVHALPEVPDVSKLLALLRTAS